MSKESFSEELFKKAPIVGIVRNLSLNEVKQILPIFREAGLTTIEITMNTPGAEDIIRYALEYESEGLNIGAGTVCTKDDLENALEAGAQFVVTPVINKKIIKSCVKKGIPVFPGGFTPTELYNAWSYGATMVKIYPATSLGPEYIKDLKAPLDKMKVLPTGGINLENMSEFLKAGADGLGIGGQLFDKKLIKEKDWAGLKLHFQKFVEKLNKR
ncbi:bifunctional 4-hydroxy-2-oxoglutarate aldolase/2-dehydro-3-deoxy-phosphogluconate aldolase [Dyadobacter frigoris]|uniref:Bifunctional 4-hydroxy-2-oxoglutarate aldolase/2-dehydro-3-deoxy-phosphogluconate aldolase n=1 Tax=Dyadobacter frigoris TaxID=2576211 RepID=A0A4U6CY72_9BACT|nr:bifunctional 4-hydroxy-2-oxoglutarate aldolase/2-dehydro-3-deoxy-phosphogluconate aldolase [Dyadobacter frigoris]TKT88198.1 bifunctional 4-hydroxy-2-oxoglutarate aldolase/2-dehydro-3-deoxy-phosphogluconate aldolase [Dyadobacter frigoris]GLU53820.1 2-dehydro-3-deoxy-phosphogluconate aldolase [Dyadobacter frigoris]